MQVKLINYTPNMVDTMATAVSKCYAKEPSKFIVQKCISSKHTSVTEHSYYSFEVSGVSRAFLAQLTRHRHLSFTVESQRYTNQSNCDFITPESIKNYEVAFDIYKHAIQNSLNCYDNLVKLGIPPEDARMILPNATETKLVVSGNYRSWMEFCEKRMDKKAQEEIREFAFNVDRLIHEVTPLKSFSLIFGYGKEGEYI